MLKNLRDLICLANVFVMLYLIFMLTDKPEVQSEPQPEALPEIRINWDSAREIPAWQFEQEHGWPQQPQPLASPADAIYYYM